MLPTQKTTPKESLSSYTMLIYGPIKIGKTTWCSQAENALFLATEPGNNALSLYSADITCWDDLLSVCAEIAEGDHKFKTIILDTIDNAYRFCTDYVCKKHKIDHPSDMGYGRGHALIFNEFQRVLNKLAFLPYGLVFVSHSTQREIETKTGKYTKTLPTLPDKIQKYILGFVDMVLLCDLDVQRGEDGKAIQRRVMRTKPNIYFEAGDRTGRLPEVMDLDYQAFLNAFSKPKASTQKSK